MKYNFEVAVTEQRDNFNEVVGVYNSENDASIGKGQELVKLSFISFKVIEGEILQNKRVYLPKEMIYNEIQPFEVIISENEPTLEDSIASSMIKIRSLVNPVISKVSGLSLYGFMVLNNELVAKGFAIYEENREETYLKILETGDEKLINKLEDYLNYKDEIDRVAQLERQFSGYMSDVKEADDIEAVYKLENEFLGKLMPQLM